jgi:hypothetical protein
MALAAVWIVFVGFFAYQDISTTRARAAAEWKCAAAKHANPSLGDPSDCFPGGTPAIDDFADAMPLYKQVEPFLGPALLPPLGALGFGATICWISAGFAPRRAI